MKVGVFLFFVILTFGWPLYWGHSHTPIWAAIIWAAVLGLFAVVTGWRHPGASALKSAIIGTVFALIGVVPAYFIGRLFS
jgi:hypothetical protein